MSDVPERTWINENKTEKMNNNTACRAILEYRK